MVFRYSLLFALFWQPTYLFAVNDDDGYASEIEPWLQGLSAEFAQLKNQPALISTLVLGSSISETATDIAKATFPRVLDAASAEWSRKLNKQTILRFNKELADALTDDALLIAASGADALLTMDTGTSEGGTYVLKIVSADGVQIPKRASASSASAFLKKALGYNGVVLSQHRSEVLVQTRDLTARKDADAVVIGESDTSLIVNKREDKRNALALLKLARGGSKFSVFRVVSSRTSEPLPVGSKVYIEE